MQTFHDTDAALDWVYSHASGPVGVMSDKVYHFDGERHLVGPFLMVAEPDGFDLENPDWPDTETRWNLRST